MEEISVPHPVRTSTSASSDPPERTATFREIFGVGEFRALFGATVLSWVGDYLAKIAVTVLVFHQTGSAGAAAAAFAISYAPSASVLANLLSEPRRATLKEFVAFADPVYSQGAQPGEQARLITPSPRGPGSSQLKFMPLIHSRHEAEAISKLFPPGQADLFLRATASEENAKAKGRLSQYGVIHFSAHGYLNENRPRFSGIVLSSPQVSPVGQATSTEDGLLSAYEIFNLKLNAELVTLSACETGLGKEIKGEGMIGLTRAFMYAGAPSVMVSLWNVDDESSADLMIGFYRHWRGAANGKLSKAEALRLAQLEAIEQSSSAYFWAPFILVGKP